MVSPVSPARCILETLTTSSRQDDKSVALAVLDCTRYEQAHVDQDEDGQKRKVDVIIFDVRCRQLVRQWFLLVLLPGGVLLRKRNQPPVDAADQNGEKVALCWNVFGDRGCRKLT